MLITETTEDSESEQIKETTEYSNNNNSYETTTKDEIQDLRDSNLPLTDDEIAELIADLWTRK